MKIIEMVSQRKSEIKRIPVYEKRNIFKILFDKIFNIPSKMMKTVQINFYDWSSKEYENFYDFVERRGRHILKGTANEIIVGDKMLFINRGKKKLTIEFYINEFHYQKGFVRQTKEQAKQQVCDMLFDGKKMTKLKRIENDNLPKWEFNIGYNIIDCEEEFKKFVDRNKSAN